MQSFRVLGTVACLASLVVGGAANAAIQGQVAVGRLSVGDWRLCEKDGRVCLVEKRWCKPAQWQVIAPTVKSPQGQFLATVQTDGSPTIQLVERNGVQAQWSFEVTATIEPREVPVGGREFMKEGEAGFRLHLKMAAGPYKGWYIAADDLTEEQERRKGLEAVYRPLKLVKDVRQASHFTYIRTKYEVIHK